MAAGLEDLNAENEIETLVRAKGFADCLCFLQAGRADLTVMTAGEPLTAAQVAQIRDVVMNKSSVTATRKICIPVYNVIASVMATVPTAHHLRSDFYPRPYTGG